MENALEDPIRAAKAVSRLAKAARKQGITVQAGNDFRYFFDLAQEVRGQKPTVFFDPDLSDLTAENAMWIIGRHKRKVVHLQAFRSCLVGEGFRQFIVNWMAGMHHRRGEPLAMKRFDASETEATKALRGRLVYHGELWIKPGRARLMDGPVDVLGRLGLLSAYLKWQPRAVFALVSGRSIRRGMVTRYGYPYIEKDFAVWDEVADEIASEEGLAIATRADLEDLVRVVAE